MNKNSRRTNTFLFVGSFIIISFTFLGMITGSTTIEKIMKNMVTATSIGVLACLCYAIFLASYNFYKVQKAYNLLLYFVDYLNTLKKEQRDSYFKGYSAEKMTEVKRDFDKEISKVEKLITSDIEFCLNKLSPSIYIPPASHYINKIACLIILKYLQYHKYLYCILY